MLLRPQNSAPAQCRCLKISIDDIDAYSYFYCPTIGCMNASPRIFYYNYPCFSCGNYVYNRVAAKSKSGAFLKRLTRLVITDDLQVHPTSSASFSDIGIMGATASALEVREFDIGQDDVINLLKSSLVTKEALTQTLLKKNEKLFKESPESSFKGNFRLGEAENGKIGVKLFVSKSKKIVCFAEVGEDFVDLVFSFLTIPVGHVLKEMEGGSIESEGCIDNIYKSIEDVDVKNFNSSKEEEMLLNPKIPPKFGYDNQLIGVKEVSCDVFFDRAIGSPAITLKDPKIPTPKEATSNGGFMAGPAMFLVTDNLNVIPISAFSRLTILNKLDVPFTDIQERVVHLGNKEAVCLLIASFVSESALTHTFLKK